MSTPAHIPGFYYDPEKKKYFRLLPSHAAPTTSFYTASSVQRQKEESQRLQAQSLETSRHLKRKRTSPRNNPYIQTTLSRELGEGSYEDLHEARRKVYALGLERRKLFDNGGNGKITAFGIDGANGESTVVVGSSGGNVLRVQASKNKDGVMECDRARMTALNHFTSQVTSISISSKRTLMASCLGSHSSPAVYLTRLPEPGSDESPTSGQHYILNVPPIRSIWSSGASPLNGDMALGTSQGVVWMQEHPYDWQPHFFIARSDVFAIEFLPTSPSTFVSGSRDGGVRVFDTRLRGDPEETRPGIIISHGSAITHVRHFNESQLVVNGLSGCALYDLRFPHPASPQISFANPTVPLVDYEGVKAGGKGCMIELGFDLDRDLGVMAVAGEDKTVRLFSIATGEKLRSRVEGRRFESICKGIRFVSGEGEGFVAVDGEKLVWYGY